MVRRVPGATPARAWMPIDQEASLRASVRMESPMVILHVEDDENDIILIHHVLKKSAPDLVLAVARDGEEAEAYLSGREPFTDRKKYPLPSLVLMDLKLPRKSGFEVIEWMKS